MSDQSGTVIAALDRIGNIISAFGSVSSIEFPQLANGPDEKVLVFNSDDRILLNAASNPPYFHSTGEGILTDLYGRILPGSKGLSSLPVDPSELGEGTQWPPKQSEPFNKPPVDNKHTTGVGYAKNFISFGDGSSLGTVGPSLAKIQRLKGGGAQFWESSVQAVCQGTGRYEGARGMLVFAGSAYFPAWPEKLEEQIKLLSAGFPARLVRCFKLALKADLA
jgi:hypothetical protein